jgi:DNA repair exonuclease SbcCD nuclease subunit
MIKLVLHTGDIHVYSNIRFDEYNEQLMKFIEKCKELSEPYEKDEVRIVICGDIVHNKLTISNDQMVLVANFIRELEKIAKVIVISGNHDTIINNVTKKDTLSGVFETAQFENAFYLDLELGFQSGYIIDDNITWVVYSIYNGYMKPDFEKAIEDYPNNTVVGLYHGDIVGGKYYNGMVMENGLSKEAFNGCNCVMMGHIHKRQVIKRDGVNIVYCSSINQKDMGESVNGHGFVLWDTEDPEDIEYKFVDVPNPDGGYFKFEINDISDIMDDKEELLNY